LLLSGGFFTREQEKDIFNRSNPDSMVVMATILRHLQR
jgi:hypothetical protein